MTTTKKNITKLIGSLAFVGANRVSSGTRRLLRPGLAAFLFVALLAACGGESDPGESNPLAETQWRLVELGDADAPTEVVGGDATAKFTTGADLTGWTGCNAYGAGYSLRGSELRLDDLSWQEAGCPSDALFRQEQQMQDALATVERFELSGDRLTLHSKAGQVLVFERVGNTSATAPEPAATSDVAPLTVASSAADNGPVDTAALPPTADRLPADPNAPTAEWVAGVNAAGWDFHRHLEGNAVSSPVSIGVAFSLSRAGASADTSAVLDGIFGFPQTDTHGAANAVSLSLAEASVDPTVLEVANRLFPDDEFSPLPEFLDIAASQYGAGIQPIDTAQAGPAADAVNRWVSQSTRDLIPTIVSEDVVRGQRLILVNTVYLKADWTVPFLPEWTEDGQFTTADGASVTVPFMHDREPGYRRYVRLSDADAVELSYQGGELAMWLIVPHDADGLAAVEESLDAETLAGLRGAARDGHVDLTMPKWEQTLPPTDLFEWLCPRGFCAGAGFDNIAPGIFITAALHGAKVIVDEKGTEAAAATAMGFPESGPPDPDLTVVADRPFLWAITHQDTGAILFVGRLVNPAA